MVARVAVHSDSRTAKSASVCVFIEDMAFHGSEYRCDCLRFAGVGRDADKLPTPKSCTKAKAEQCDGGRASLRRSWPGNVREQSPISHRLQLPAIPATAFSLYSWYGEILYRG